MKRPEITEVRDLSKQPVNVLFVGQQVSLAQRRGRYAPTSMRHPGKMLPELARQLIRAYTVPGDWILDPMSGIGTTGVEATHLGRNYVGIELEPRFVAWQRENLELAREQGAAGEGVAFAGDARDLDPGADSYLADLTVPQPIAAVITSPPYGDRLRPKTSQLSQTMRDLIARGAFRSDVIPGSYGTSPNNLGNLSDEAYLQEMRRVYRGAFHVLKPGGILAIVIRPGRDRQRLRPLHYQTATLCTDLGFDWIDEIVAVLGGVSAVPGQSASIANRALFFKRLAVAHLRESGHPVTLEQAEYVLVFQKPERSFSPLPTHKGGRQTALVGASLGFTDWEASLPGS